MSNERLPLPTEVLNYEFSSCKTNESNRNQKFEEKLGNESKSFGKKIFYSLLKFALMRSFLALVRKASSKLFGSTSSPSSSACRIIF